MMLNFGNIHLPKNTYSIYQIATFENIPHETMSKLATKTLDNILKASPKKDGKSIERAFNCLGRYDYSVNAFLNHWSLAPFAKGIKMRCETSIQGRSLKKNDFIAFYVDKKDYELWKFKGIEYTEKPDNQNIENKAEKALKNTKVNLPLNDTIKKFKDTMTVLGYSFSEGVQLAVSFFMQKNNDIFGEEGQKEISEKAITENKTSLIYAYINPDIKNNVWKTLQRYNAVNFPPIRFNDFLETALAEKLSRTDIRYTNPELYKEYLKTLEENERIEEEMRQCDESV